MKKSILFSSSLVILVAGCGGGSNTNLHEVLASAEQKEAEVRALAVEEPCSSNQQCSTVYFTSPTSYCDSPRTVENTEAYSRLAATAEQVEIKAAEHRQLAQQALLLQPDLSTVCPAVVYSAFPICQANKCSFTTIIQ